MVAAVGLAVFAFVYVTALQLFGPFGFSAPMVSAGIGVIHFVGFCAAAFFCFVIGVGLCACGVCGAANDYRRVSSQRQTRPSSGSRYSPMN